MEIDKVSTSKDKAVKLVTFKNGTSMVFLNYATPLHKRGEFIVLEEMTVDPFELSILQRIVDETIG